MVIVVFIRKKYLPQIVANRRLYNLYSPAGTQMFAVQKAIPKSQALSGRAKR